MSGTNPNAKLGLLDRFKAMLARVEAPAAPPSHNLLVCSDLHIGQDLKADGRLEVLERKASFDHQFCSFLNHYANQRIDGRPWRLVIDGDMVDFMHINVLPDAWEQTRGWRGIISDEERVFGLDGEVDKVLFKLDAAMSRHRPVFEALATFISLGNELWIVSGNHDVEWHWTQVQQAFKLKLGELYEKIHGLPPGSKRTNDEVISRIVFHPWFYYEPGVVFIEHGHQYDEYSSFEYLLNPVTPVDRRRAEMTAGHLVIRYFINALSGVDHHGKESWDLLDYARWLVASGWRHLPKLAFGYFRMCYMLVVYNRRERAAPHDAIAAEHEARLRELAQSSEVEMSRLERLDALKRPPITKSLVKTLQLVMADRVASGIVGLLLLGGAIVLPLPWWGRLLMVGLAPALALGVDQLRLVDSPSMVTGKLIESAGQVAALMDVRYVVCGHTHESVCTQVREGAKPAWYVNTGTWVPFPHDEAGPAEQHARHVPFTHFVLRRGHDAARGQTHETWAELRRWDPGSNGPALVAAAGPPYDATGPQEIPAEVALHATEEAS